MKTGRPTTYAFNGMVATPHMLASVAGLNTLQDGGSAIDAVIAANAVLMVVYPDQTSIGGDCFLLYHDAASGRLHGLNGSGRSPRRAERNALRERFGRMPARGIHSVTVPGTIDAWATASERFGKLGLDRLLQPAIGYASNGFPVSPNLAAGIAGTANSGEWTVDLESIYFPGWRSPSAGSRLRLPELADSLRAIAQGGRDLFYTGSIAEAIVAASNRLGGWFDLDDLASHRAEWVEPVLGSYRGTEVAEMPPNSQGVTALIELNLAELVEPAGWGDGNHLHSLIEAKKRAFATRDAELGEPGSMAVAPAKLASKAFAKELWSDYDPTRASAGTSNEAGDTVYLCAIDRDGNAASLIQSMYLNFGSGVVADGTGIVLQCRGASFNLDDDHPNRFEGGKRPLHTLMPGMLMRDGRLIGPFGTQGGDAQAQIHLQLVTNLIDYDMTPQEAIEAPRWVAGGGRGSDPRLVGIEHGFPAETARDLGQRGHRVEMTGQWDHDFGHAQMILRDEARGLLLGAADPRADGVAIGY